MSVCTRARSVAPMLHVGLVDDPPRVRALRERFFDCVAREPGGAGHWLWMASKNKWNHGRCKLGEGSITAHRLAWLLLVGPVPLGCAVTHWCGRTDCVRPEHLQLDPAVREPRKCVALELARARKKKARERKAA